MKPFKIYLSTSNRASQDVRLAVIDLIKKCGLESTKFAGGKYSPATMMSSDAIIIIGESFQPYIGKGIYTELKFALENNPKKFVNRIFFITEMQTLTVINIKLVTAIAHYNVEDWTSQYGILTLNEEPESLAIQLTKFSKELAAEKSDAMDAEDIDW